MGAVINNLETKPVQDPRLAVAAQSPHFPDVEVTLRSRNRWAVAAAIRQAMRRAGKDRQEIDRFLSEALAAENADLLHAVCNRWVRLQLQA